MRTIEAQYADSTGRLDGALHTAAAVREATASEAADQDRRLAQRQRALERVSRLLEEAVTSDTGSGAEVGATPAW